MTREVARAVPPLTETARRVRLRAVGLCVGYGRDRVIDDLSLDIPDAQLTVIVGPNGCGKSTLLKAMARALPLGAGSVVLDGACVHASPTRAIARKLAFLPQGPAAPEGLRVSELVAQGRHPHRSLLRQWSPGDADAVARAMTQAGVADLADRPVSALSGGQRQRCWIAMTLAQETEILLLDEPTTFLDLRVQIDLMTLLRRIAHEDGRTLVVVMHELNLAAAFADRMVMMRDARVMAEGTVHDVFRPDMLRAVFDLEVTVLRDPATGRPVCVPRPVAVAEAAE